MEFRAEEPGDAASVRHLLETSFEGNVEANIVELLRKANEVAKTRLATICPIVLEPCWQ